MDTSRVGRETAYDDEDDEEDRSIAKFPRSVPTRWIDPPLFCAVPRTFLRLYNAARRGGGGGVPPSQANRETKEVEVS